MQNHIWINHGQNTTKRIIRGTGCTEPKIGMKIVARASTTNERKIKEARVILKNNSDLNDKKEQMDLRRFLV